jgi:hypothetical protein
MIDEDGSKQIVEKIFGSDLLDAFNNDDQFFTIDEFLEKIRNQYESVLRGNDWYDNYKIKLQYWDATASVFGERLETDKEKEARVKKENQLRMRELAELKRLREKYGDYI